MKKLLAVLALTLLAACQDAPSTFTAAPLSFQSDPPFQLNVAQIKLVDNYHAPLSPPNVDHQFPITPANGVRQWVKDRMRAVGRQGTLEIAIDDASVKEVLLPKTRGIQGLFTYDQDARFDASLRVTFRLYDGVNPMSIASGDVLIARSKSISERSSADDRKRLFDAMLRDLMDRFDQSAEARMNQFFTPYLVKQ